MKKLFILTAVLFVFSVLLGEKSDFEFIRLEKNVSIINPDTFVAKKLPAAVSLKNPLIKGKIENSNTISGVSIHRVSWEYNNIPIIGKFTVIKEKNGKIFNIINGIKDFSLDTEPALSAERAASAFADRHLGDSVFKFDFISQLVIIDYLGEYKLAYRLRFRPKSMLDGRFFFVDANTGKLLRTGNLIKQVSNKAKVFEMNPVSTPDPIEIDLPWVADDADGKLSAKADEKGLRKIVAANCPDEGETFKYYDYDIPRCTVKQLADKNKNGSFIYEDWANGVKYSHDVKDIYPEISLYYHMTKIYEYLSSLGLKEYAELPNHNKKNPIVGVANLQMTGYFSGYNTGDLRPYDNAFYSKHDPYFAEMLYGDFEYNQSDTLVFGQGQKADFAYDGDVIYHEFGHGVVEGVGQLNYEGHADKYGFTNEILGMNEGMADVFSFIMTNDPCLAEYVAKGVGKFGGAVELDGLLCLRTTTNTNLVNEDFIGESHNDGLPLVGAHWEIYQKMLENGFTKDDFAKIFLTALASVPSSDITYKEWGEIFLETAKESVAANLKGDFEKILTDRGFFNEIRARNITRKADVFYTGGVGDGYTSVSSDTVVIEYDDDYIEVSPMYIQFYYDVPECINTLKVTADTASQTRGGNPEFMVLVREDVPIAWKHNMDASSAKYDRIVEGNRNSWTFENLEPGKRYYFHFINTGAAGYLYKVKTSESWNSDEECTPSEPEPEPEDNDNETGDSDSVENPDDGGNEKESSKSSGCSMTIF